MRYFFFLSLLAIFLPLSFTYAGYLTVPAYPIDITSFFDHDSPDYTINNNFTRYDGIQWVDGSASPSSCTLGINCYDGHNGVDFDGVTGDDILAAAPGVIRELYWNNCGGNTMRLWHQNEGHSTLYAHLQSLSYVSGIATGTIVTRSQHIADMGDTGSCTNADHLHFGVADADSQAAQRIDPYGWSGLPGGDPWPHNQGYLWTTNPPSLNVAIYVSGNISQDTTWLKENIYVIQGTAIVDPGVMLTIESGTIVKFDTDANIRIDGALIAQGTEDSKIYFTSLKDDSVGGDTNNDGNATNPNPGDYSGLRTTNFLSSADLKYTVFQYGGLKNILCLLNVGGCGVLQNDAGVIDVTHSEFYFNYLNAIKQIGSGSLSLQKSIVSDTFRDSNYYAGVTQTGGTLTIYKTKISDSGGVFVSGSNMGTNITQSSLDGVSACCGSPIVNATQNYWGHSSGPYHPTLNPNGQGNQVSDNVNFIPWLTKDPTIIPQGGGGHCPPTGCP